MCLKFLERFCLVHERINIGHGFDEMSDVVVTRDLSEDNLERIAFQYLR
jgi:hypothetical protein